eukprot:scaffold8010_cov258-Pinguiococcus_pyrenoidosus.AAC.2
MLHWRSASRSSAATPRAAMLGYGEPMLKGKRRPFLATEKVTCALCARRSPRVSWDSRVLFAATPDVAAAGRHRRHGCRDGELGAVSAGGDSRGRLPRGQQQPNPLVSGLERRGGPAA